MELDWADHLSVGNAIIDADHKNLIITVNSVEHAIGTKDRAAMSKAFVLLETYMLIHFTNEEKIAEAVNFPFASNKLEHQRCMEEMNAVRDELEKMNGIWSDELANKYIRFLSIWMVDHITKEDMLMKPVLETYPYDFKPG